MLAVFLFPPRLLAPSHDAQDSQEQVDDIHVKSGGAVHRIVQRLRYLVGAAPVIADVTAEDEHHHPIDPARVNTQNKNLEQLDPGERRPIGNIGYLKQAMTPEGFKDFVSEKLGYDALHLPAEKSLIQKVGFCTGGAQDYIHKAAVQNCDAYISGEVSERTFYDAQELDVHYYACGHHATEKYGVQRLAKAISEQFNIEYSYFELNNPI